MVGFCITSSIRPSSGADICRRQQSSRNVASQSCSTLMTLMPWTLERLERLDPYCSCCSDYSAIFFLVSWPRPHQICYRSWHCREGKAYERSSKRLGAEHIVVRAEGSKPHFVLQSVILRISNHNPRMALLQLLYIYIYYIFFFFFLYTVFFLWQIPLFTWK